MNIKNVQSFKFSESEAFFFIFYLIKVKLFVKENVQSKVKK